MMPRPNLDRLLPALADAVRVGHATNSSSSHSIVVCRGPAATEVTAIDPESPSGYFWDWFRLTERAAKADYLSVMLSNQVRHMTQVPEFPLEYTHRLYEETQWLSESIGMAYSQQTFGRPCPDLDIDHDSQFSFPMQHDRRRPDQGFARWFDAQVADPRVAILGGNDNSDPPPGFEPVGAARFAASLPDDEFTSPMTVLDRGDHWLLYAPKTGRRMRMAKVLGRPIKTTSHPELMDIKITDYCDIGCTYCYQDSTAAGVQPPSDIGSVAQLASMIAATGVREVALGGGEPTSWPGTWLLVKILTDRGVVVNMTTRRPTKIPRATVALMGSVGVSVDTAKQAKAHVRSLLSDEDDVWGRSGRLTFHVVMGAVPMDEVVEICRVAAKADNGQPHVLLLGYKTTGRGAPGAVHPYEDWTTRLRDAFMVPNSRGGTYWDGPSLGVDTVLVESHRERIASDLGSNHRLMTDREGAFSLYVDAVTMTYGRHSYGAPMLPVPPLGGDYRAPETAAAEILRGFRAWNA